MYFFFHCSSPYVYYFINYIIFYLFCHSSYQSIFSFGQNGKNGKNGIFSDFAVEKAQKIKSGIQSWGDEDARKTFLYGNENIVIPKVVDTETATSIVDAFAKFNGETIDEFFDDDATKAKKWSSEVKEAFAEYAKTTNKASQSTEGFVAYTQDLHDSAEKVKSSFSGKGLLGSVKDIGASLASSVVNAGISIAVSWAINKAFEGIYNAIHASEIKIEKGQEAQKLIQEAQSQYDEKAEAVESFGETYAKLREKVGAKNQNIGLTTDEYSQFIAINNQLADMFPSLVSGYDAQGNAILSLGSSADETSDKLQNLLEQEKNLTNFKTSESLQTAFEGTMEQIRLAQQELQETQETITNLEIQKGVLEFLANGDKSSLNNIGLDLDENGNLTFDLFIPEEASDAAKELFIKQQNAFTKAANDMQLDEFQLPNFNFNDNAYKNDKFGQEFTGQLPLLTPDQQQVFMDDYKAMLKEQGVSEDLVNAYKVRETDKKEIAADWRSMVGSIINSMSTYDAYESLGDNMKQAINTAIGNINPVAEWMKDDGTWELPDNIRADMRAKYLDTIDKVFSDNSLEGKSAQKAMTSLFDLDPSKMNVEKYTTAVSKAMNVLSGYLSEEELNEFALRFGFKIEDEDGNPIDSTEAMIEDIKSKLPEGSKYADLLNELTVEQLVNIHTVLEEDPSTSAEHAIHDAMRKREATPSATFAEFLGSSSDENSQNAKVDVFQEKISALQTALDGLKSGSYSESDITDLIQQFPQLGTALDSSTQSVEGLKTALGGLQVTALSDFVEEYRKGMESITDPTQLQAARDYLENIVKSVNLSDADLSDMRSKVFEAIWGDNVEGTGERQNWLVSGLLSHIDTNDKIGQEALYKTVLNAGSDIFSWSADQIQAAVDQNISDINVRNASEEITRLQSHRDMYAHQKTSIENANAIKEARGERLTEDDYKGLLRLNKSDLYDAQRQLEQAQIIAKRQASTYGTDSDQYKEAAANVRTYSEAIQQLTLDQVNLENSIKQLPLDELGREMTSLQENATAIQDKMNLDSARGVKSTVKDYQDLVTNSNLQIRNLQTQNNLLQSQLTGMSPLSSKYSEITSQIASNVSAIDQARQSQIEWNEAARQLQYQPEEGLTAYNKAKETRNAGDNYLDMMAAFKEAQKAYKNGLIGTDEFKAAAKMLSPNGMDDAANWAENYGKAQRYFTEDRSGLLNFLNDLKGKTNEAGEALASVDEATGQWSYNIDDVQGSADALGISFESFLAIMGRLQDYGYSNNFFSSVEEGEQKLGDLYYDLTEAEADLQRLEDKKDKGIETVSSTALAAQEQKVNAIKQSILDTQSLLDQLLAKSDEELNADFAAKMQRYGAQINKALGVDDKDSQQSYLKTIYSKMSEELGQEQLDSIFYIDDNGSFHIIEEGLQNIIDKYGTLEDMDTTHTQEAIGELTKQINDNKDAFQDDLNVLKDYTQEEISSITFGDGQAESDPRLAAAESAIDDIIQGLGLSQDEASILIQTLAKMGLIKADIEPELDKDSVDEAMEEGQEEVDKNGVLVSEVDLQVRDEATADLQRASDLLSAINGETAYADVNVSSAEDAQAELDDIVNKLAQLDRDTLISIGFKPSTKDAPITAEDIRSQIGKVDVPMHYSSDGDQEEPQDEEAKVNYTRGDQAPPLLKTAPVSYNSIAYQAPPKDMVARVIYQGSLSPVVNQATSGGSAAGTAHASGTAYSMWTDFRHSTGAYANGSAKDWRLPADETALVNEVGTESIVRDGKWFPIPGGAHMENLQKGDIIFSAAQTKELVETGKVLSDGGHGRVIGSTSYADGTDHASGLVGKVWRWMKSAWKNARTRQQQTTTNNWTRDPAPRTPQTTPSYTPTNTGPSLGGGGTGGGNSGGGGGGGNSGGGGGNGGGKSNNNSGSNEFSDWLSKFFDWAEVRLNRLNRLTEKWSDRAEKAIRYSYNAVASDKNIDKQYSAKKAYTQKAIQANANEITGNEKSIASYRSFLDRIVNKSKGKLDGKTLDKIRNDTVNGTFDIQEYADKGATKGKLEMIQAYQEWYEKILNCQDSIEELRETQKDLAEQLMNLPLDQATAKVEKFQAALDRLSSAYDAVSGGSTAYLKQVVSDSKAAYDAAKKNYAEQKALQREAQQSFKEQQQNMQKVSGLSKTQKAAVKAGTKINTNGLKGDALKAAQKYNTAWEKKINANSSTAEAREYYKSTIKDYKENQKLYKKYKNKPSYQYQNALLNRQTAEQKKINDANQQALRTTNRNVETSKKERDTTQNQLKNYKESILGNSQLKLSNEQKNAIKNGQQAALYGASGATLEALKKYNEYLEASKNATNKYNSSLEANAEAINNAAESQAEYVKMLQENAKQAFDNVIDYFGSKADLMDSRISNKEAQRNYYDAAGISQTGKTYSRSYRSQISNTESAISNKQEELKKAKAAYKANSKNMSEKDRRSALAEIEGLETELLNLKADAADLKSELAQLDILKLTLALDKLSAAADKLEHKLNMIQGHNKLPGESAYMGLINNAGQQISNYEQQNAKLRKQQGGYQKGSKKWQELQDQIVSNESAIDGLLEKQMEWRKSIVNIPVELAARKTEKLSKNLEILQKRLENASKASVAYQAGIIRAEQRNAQQTYETAKALPGQIKRKQNQNASKGLAAYKGTIGKGTYTTNKDGTLKANRKATDADKRKINQYNAWRKAISAGKEVNTDHLDKNSNAYKYFDSYNLAFDEYNTALKDKSMAVQDYISTTTELAEALANLPIDKMNEKLEKVNTAQEILQAQYNNLDGYETKNKNLNKQNAKAKEERDLYRNTKNYTAARVKNEFKNVAAIAKAQGKTEGQKLSLEGIEVGSDAYIAIKNYNAAIDASKTAADNAAKAEENYTSTIRANAKARFDNVISDYESQQSVQEAEASRLSTRLQWQESMGIAKDSDTTKDIYEQSIANNEGLILSKREELAKAQAAYNANYQDMSEEDLHAAQAQILALQEDIQKTEITNEDLKDSMRSDIYYTKFEKALEKTEALRKSLEAINSIITDDAMYDKNGLLTDMGYAKLATSYKDYESSLADIATLQEKIATIKSLKGTNGMSEEEYVKELTEAQGELADKLQETASARENVLTIMKSLAQAELDAVNKVIDARKDALQKKKDYYDYDKQLRNGTKELNLLKQQRAALEGISGLEAERKRKELDQQISDKQESLEDTIQDHLYNIQVEGLEDLKTELQENYEDYVRDLAQNLDKIKDVMNGVGDTVSDAAKNINKTLRNILAQYGVTLSDLGVKGYASGTKNVPHTGLYEVNEHGNEMIVTPEGHILMPLTKGTGVINADMTANLMAAAKTGAMPQSYLVDPSIPQMNRSITITNHYDSLLTVNGDVSKDTLPELQTILKESYKYTTQQLSKEFSLLGHR